MTRNAVATGLASAPGFVPGIYLRRLLELWGHQVPDAGQLVATLAAGAVGKELDALEFPYRAYADVVERLLAGGVEPSGGLQLGAGFGFQDYGILGYAVMSCRDLGQFLDTFSTLDALFGVIAELDRRLDWRDDVVAYQSTCHLITPAARQFEEVVPLAQFTAVRSLLANPDKLQFAGADFSFPAPRDPAPYAALFGCPVRFDQPITELRLPLAQLCEPFALGNQDVWQACEQQCETLLRAFDQGGVLTEQVRQLILQAPGETVDPNVIAARVHLSPRTLRRRLQEEGTSYNSIVNEVREHLACRYLADTNLAIKEVGFLLGYSEVANFQRAFKKWLGQTPGAYRQAHRPGH